MAHVVGVALHQVAQTPLGKEAVEVLVLSALTQVEGDVGAMVVGSVTLPRLRRLDGVAADAVGLPRIGLLGTVCAGDHAHLGGNHEARVEPDAELADDVDVLALVLGVLLLEGLAAGVSDRAEVLIELGFGHADAVVGDGDGAGVFVEGKRDGEVLGAEVDRAVGERLELQLVDGIARIGHKLAQEDLAVGVDRVDHEVEELLALCLELAHGVYRFLLSIKKGGAGPPVV